MQYNGVSIGSGYRVYLHADYQSSIVAQSNGSGDLVATLAYDVYGIPEAKNASAVGAFGYTGQIYLPSLGLDYYKARFYHPQIGRFLQTDLIGYKDDYNLYAYVGNDPVNATDPSGMAKCGSNLTGEKCEQALDDSERARNAAQGIAAGLKDIAGRMKSGKMTDSDKSVVNAVKDKFGSKFGSEKGLNKLANNLNKAADKIGARGEGATLVQGNNKSFSNGDDKPAYANYFTGKISLNNSYFESGNKSRSFYMLHEGAHLAGAWRDAYIRGGDNSLYDKSSGYSNADTYSCLAYPSSCGYSE